MGIVRQDTRNGKDMDMGIVKGSVVVQYVLSLLGDPNVRFRETAGGWNEDGESLPSLDPFGGDGRYSSYGIVLLRAVLGCGQNRHVQSGVLKTL